jgi:hypothetical protein
MRQYRRVTPRHPSNDSRDGGGPRPREVRFELTGCRSDEGGMPVKGCRLGGDEAACAQSGLLADGKGQPFVLCEVGEVLDVEGGKREIIDKAAGGYPGIVLRAGPSASLRAGLELALFLRRRFVVGQDSDMLTPAGQFAGAARPQLRSTRHFISSPTVTKVMHIVWPARAARSWSGRRLRKLKDATSGSRTTRLT